MRAENAATAAYHALPMPPIDGLQTIPEAFANKRIGLTHKPHRLAEFISMSDRLQAGAYWRLLAGIWIETEFSAQQDGGYEAWDRLFAADLPSRGSMMSDIENTTFAALPERFEIFRGINAEYIHLPHGMSWTLDRRKAIWFAQRSATFESMGTGERPEPMLLTSEVNRSAVYALFLERGESEVLVAPGSLEAEATALEPAADIDQAAAFLFGPE